VSKGLGWWVQEEEEIEGISGSVLTLEGENGRVAVGSIQRRPAAASRGGGALVHFRPWEGAEDAQLEAWISWWCWLGSKVNGSGKTWAAAASSAMADGDAALCRCGGTPARARTGAGAA
jgi:hypothetical protein